MDCSSPADPSRFFHPGISAPPCVEKDPPYNALKSVQSMACASVSPATRTEAETCLLRIGDFWARWIGRHVAGFSDGVD